ncbi:hypothetical protein BGZ61DRAFT_517196 [Ilyonectria robusta]|uniref:uncharacterized protein n=1 Tax=Ilyonectria robusta TaxID=1079257 RepID=UPI001E8EF1F7|nr:uncharacterized protein BGZ61DRAFT_517196 [Ilyonectria robusta]KAH8706566.1 hypothetical protein BGZ61DRAFT_517196 [Ilyonectria robusta]
MRRYYKTCMHDNPPETYQLKPAVRIADKVHAAFSRYDPPHDEKKMKKKKEFGKDIETNPEPMVNGSLPLDISDGRIVRNATLAMARYQIWGFAKFAPQQSVFNTSAMAIGVEPYISNGLPRKELYDSEPIAYEYKRIIAAVLKRAYRSQWRAHHYNDLAEQVFKMERRILDIAPTVQAWQRGKGTTAQMSVDRLSELAPELMIGDVIRDQAGTVSRPSLKNTEVMFPHYWTDLQGIVKTSSKSAVRAYLVWQIFLQTQHLLEHWTVEDYRNILREIDGTKSPSTRNEQCTERAAKHFGHVMSSMYAQEFYSKEAETLAESIFQNIKEQYIKLFEETQWMDPKSKERAIEKAKSMDIMAGFSKENPNLRDWSDIKNFYVGALVQPTRNDSLWSNADDYLELEALHTRESWRKELHRPPNKFKWFKNTFDVDIYYSQELNKLVVPAGILQKPMMDPGMPAYVNYGSLGTIMAQKMAHAFDAQGRMFSSTGKLESWMTKGDLVQFDYRQLCFQEKYNFINVTDVNGEVYNLNGKQVADEVIADTYGHEMAYRAWKTRVNGREENMLRGYHQFTDDQMFWLMRSKQYCSLEQDETLLQELNTSPNPPNRIESWAPLTDSLGWRESFGCKPKKKEILCQLWGNDQHQKTGDKAAAESGKKNEAEDKTKSSSKVTEGGPKEKGEEKEKEKVVDKKKVEENKKEEDSKPTKQQGKPTKEQGKPAKQQDKPAKQQDKPAKQQGKPAKQQDKPTKEQGKPAKQQDKPAKQQGKPTKEQGKLTKEKKPTKEEVKANQMKSQDFVQAGDENEKL